MHACVCVYVGTTYFHALTPLVGWQEGHRACVELSVYVGGGNVTVALLTS